MESIVRHQQPFFENGVTKLAPLILKDIADDISMLRNKARDKAES